MGRSRGALGWGAAVAVALTVSAVTGVSAQAAGAGDARPKAVSSQVTLVQGVPDSTMGLTVDGRVVKPAAREGAIVGPINLAPGSHSVTFTPAGGTAISTTVTTAAGSTTDVVIHSPAAVDGVPVINTYDTPLNPIGPEKARLMLAHTATVAPADVDFDGQVVFRNIANGEFARADVPAGDHQVALLPAGQTTDPILGPLSVALKPSTVTMVYAVGRPQNGSMKVITHTVTLDPATGKVEAPSRIKTGSAGLVSEVSVRAFSSVATPAARRMALTASAAGSSA